MVLYKSSQQQQYFAYIYILVCTCTYPNCSICRVACDAGFMLVLLLANASLMQIVFSVL